MISSVGEIKKTDSLFDVVGKRKLAEIQHILSAPPICIDSSMDTIEGIPFYLLKYNQIKSDFSYKCVRQARGVIFKDGEQFPVCYPMDKFGNYGESYAAKIDWQSARILQKIDGSLVKRWWNPYTKRWMTSTNGTIDAYKAQLPGISPFPTFGDLFGEALNRTISKEKNRYREWFDQPQAKNYTYMFELVSPYNRVVVPYRDIAIYFLGARSIYTLQEVDINIGIRKPPSYDLSNPNLDDVIEIASHLPFSEEGYVVIDKYFDRIKVKSPAYVAAHRLKNNGVITEQRIIELVQTNETSEFLNYFPEYKPYVEKVESILTNAISDIFVYWNSPEREKIGRTDFSDPHERRKEYAIAFKSFEYPSFLFSLLDGRIEPTVTGIRKAIRSMTPERIEKTFNIKIDIEAMPVMEDM